MSLTLNLSPEVEEKLQEDAERIGVPAEALVNRAVEDIVLNQRHLIINGLRMLYMYPNLNKTTGEFLELLRLVQIATMFSPISSDPRFQATAKDLSQLFGHILQVSLGEAPRDLIEEGSEKAQRQKESAVTGKGMFAGRGTVANFLAERHAEGEADYDKGVEANK